MAEEVEISNVGGENGVASEATLASLTRAIEKLAASTGRDPKKEAGKVQKAHNDAVKNGITIVTKNRDALEEKTKATKKATDATNRYSKAIIGAIGGLLGSVTQSALGLGRALFDGKDQLTDFAKHIPIVGSYLTTFTEILDNTFEVFRNVSSSGASFNNSMVDLMRASAAARMSIDDFGSLVTRNSEQLAAFGGTATKGAQTIGRLQQGLGSMRNDLLNMGFTFEEINEALINYQFINRAGNRAQFQSQQQLALAAGEYLMHLGELSKLTGKSVDQLQNDLQERQTNAAFQMKLAKMDPVQRARIQEGLADALALGGQAGADRFMQMVLGMGPLTEETAILAATMPGVEQALRNLANSAQDARLSNEQFAQAQTQARVDIVKGALASAQDFESLLAAAASGVGGPANTLLDILNGMGIDFARYAGLQGAALEQAILQDMESAQAEQNRRDALTRSMAAFNERITEARRTIQEQFINSGIYSHAATLVQRFSDLFASETMMNAIRTVIDLLGDFADSMFGFLEGFSAAEDPKEYLKTAVQRIGDIIQDYLFGESAAEQQVEAETELNTISEQSQRFVDRMTEIQQSLMSAADPNEIRRLNTEYESLVRQRNDLAARETELTSNIAAGFEDTPGVISEAISSIWQNTDLITKIAIGAAGLFAASPIVNAVANGVRGLLSLFGGGNTDAPASSSRRSRRPVGGSAGQGIGNFLGQATGGALSGTAKGLSAFANPMVPIGAAALGAAITAIGAGIAGATWLMGSALPTLAEGLSSFETLNAEKLSSVGSAMLSLAGGLAAFGGANIISAIGNLFQTDEGLSETARHLEAFQNFNVDAAKVENNARAMVAFGTAMSSFGAGAALSGIGSVVSAIGGAIASLFGRDSPLEQLQSFGNAEINSEGVERNANAMASFAEAMSRMAGADFSNVDIPGRLVNRLEELSQITGSGLTITAEGMQAIANVQGLEANLDILNSGLNIDKVSDYTEALENLVETLNNLNQELSRDNNGFGLGTGTNAGDVLGQINTASTGSSEGINQLNRLMSQMLAVMQEMAEDADNIERNTRSMGSNIANGRISAVR